MSSFEKEYYESENFWEGDMLQDPPNQERIRITASIIPADVKTLVDIGCGNGIFINYLAKNYNNLNLTGVDRSETALKYVTVKKIVGDISKLPFEDKFFDCATCLEVIEHLPLPVYKLSLQELTRIAKKDIIISVPYDEKLEEGYTRCPSCRTIFNKDIHLRTFNEIEVLNLLNEFGFECVSTQKLNPVTRFKSHNFYRKLFYPEQFVGWDSPICPLCGYEQKNNAAMNARGQNRQNGMVTKRKWISYLSVLPKLFWPKETHYYWILARYQRIS